MNVHRITSLTCLISSELFAPSPTEQNLGPSKFSPCLRSYISLYYFSGLATQTTCSLSLPSWFSLLAFSHFMPSHGLSNHLFSPCVLALTHYVIVFFLTCSPHLAVSYLRAIFLLSFFLLRAYLPPSRFSVDNELNE